MNNNIYHMHHIIPRHAGGSNDKENLIKLNIDQHALAHKLLWEQNGSTYDYIAWKSLSNQMTKAEARIEAVKHANTGRKQSKEHIEKRTKARLITRPNSTLGQKNKPCSEERKRKISEANKGKDRGPRGPRSDETKNKMSNSAKNRPLFNCSVCGKAVQKQTLALYHGIDGSKCKLSAAE
jgi:hypothetical protein